MGTEEKRDKDKRESRNKKRDKRNTVRNER